MKERCDTWLTDDKLATPKKKLLTSLKEHWPGLTIFLEHPQVAMDNNTAERGKRNPVIGRKNYYGSGRIWSAILAALMFSSLQTILLWGINPGTGCTVIFWHVRKMGEKRLQIYHHSFPGRWTKSVNKNLVAQCPLDSKFIFF